MDKIRRKNWTPTQYSSVCSEHFEVDCYEAERKIRRLKNTAIPTIFPQFPSYLQETKRVKRPLNRQHQEDIENVPPQKKIRFVPELSAKMIVEIDHTYIQPSSENLKILLDQKSERNQNLKKKLQQCQKENKKLNQQCDDLLGIVLKLQKRSLIGKGAFEILKKAASDVPLELFRRLQNNLESNLTTRTSSYPEALRNFAMTLHFYSAKAYR